MKASKFLVIIMVLISAVFSISCKRGEEDPFLSFRSRDQRLKGWWKVEEMIIDTAYTEVDKYVDDYDYDVGTAFYKVDILTTISKGKRVYEYKKYWKYENNKAFLIDYLDTVKFIRTFSDCDVYVCFDENNNLTVQWNRTTLYRKDYYSDPYNNFLNYGDNIDTMQYETVEMQPHRYTITETGKWQWADKKKTVLEAGLFSGTVTKLSYKEVKIKFFEDKFLKEKESDVYYPHYRVHSTLSRTVSIKVTLVRPDENQ